MRLLGRVGAGPAIIARTASRIKSCGFIPASAARTLIAAYSSSVSKSFGSAIEKHFLSQSRNFPLAQLGNFPYSSIVSDTQETLKRHYITGQDGEQKRTFHWKMRPSAAKRLAVYARRKGMQMGGAMELAIDLLIANDRPLKKA